MAPAVVAIVGAGFSGSLLALHLLGAGRYAPKILLFERASGFGKGVAYATGNPSHLLNVRAANMSAFPDRPDHFLDWLRRQPGMEAAGPASFVPRATYGAYLQDMLTQAVRQPEAAGRLVLVPDDAAALRRQADGLVLTAGVGRDYRVDACVLAIGNLPPETPAVGDWAFYSSPRFHADPWQPGMIAEIGRQDRVLLIGTGLTMVDVVLALQAQGHRGRVHALSRRGLLPRRHPAGATHAVPSAPALPGALSDALHTVRAAIRAEVAASRDWQPVIDSLRPWTRSLWQGLDTGAKARFLRHLRPWWDVHRHRLSPPVADRIQAMQAAGLLQVTAGRLRHMADTGAAARISWLPRGSERIEEQEVDHVINCAGPGCDLRRARDPLVQDLLASGLVRPDPLHLGLDVSTAGQVISAAGQAVEGVYAIGPVTRGAFWEITAVPDIRVQARDLARMLLTQRTTQTAGAPQPTAAGREAAGSAHDSQ
ncbi:FAD/NAD(P)-binding protein [Oleisolibacter albus]|uniref:FAD/NAD(P)-binding protein n=1 Tax=Oleisolibacter albus TaxID=2171757 RepID=UPI000DF1FA15|nr:FAD/NAD(P)-binding protein [Oleisolibacter albus]